MQKKEGINSKQKRWVKINYQEWAEEYWESAGNLVKTIRKYENMVSDNNGLEYLNSKIYALRNIRRELINTAKLLERRGKYIEKHTAK